MFIALTKLFYAFLSEISSHVLNKKCQTNLLNNAGINVKVENININNLATNTFLLTKQSEYKKTKEHFFVYFYPVVKQFFQEVSVFLTGKCCCIINGTDCSGRPHHKLKVGIIHTKYCIRKELFIEKPRVIGFNLLLP